MSRGDRGSATVEMAMALPALVVVVAIALWGIAATAAKLACVDAVHAGARAAARGEPAAEVRAQVLRVAPAGSVLTLTQSGETTRLVLETSFQPPARVPLPALTFRVAAEAVTEPSVR